MSKKSLNSQYKKIFLKDKGILYIKSLLKDSWKEELKNFDKRFIVLGENYFLKRILDKINLNKGKAFDYLPSEKVSLVGNINHLLAYLLKERLKKNENIIIVFPDPFLNFYISSDLEVIERILPQYKNLRLKILRIDDRFYFLADKTDSLEQIHFILDEINTSNSRISGIGLEVNDFDQIREKTILDKVNTAKDIKNFSSGKILRRIKNIPFLIVTAYDGDGFILWESEKQNS